MKQFLITVAGVLVGLVLFVIVAPIALIASFSSGAEKPVTPAAVVLELDLRREIPDQRPQGPFAAFGDKTSTIEIVRKLEAAARDDKVKGVFVRANTMGMAPAQAEEIRSALAAVRGADKFVIAHIQNDALRASLAGYTAVAGADEIWLHHTGEFMPMGLAAELTFLGGTFEKFRITPQFEQREEYKNAVNEFTQKGLTAAHRESVESMLGSIYAASLNAIAADRKMPVATVKSLIEGTPYVGADAVKLKLVDKLGRPEDAEAAALERAGEDAEILEFAHYQPSAKGGPVIALVAGEGAILSGPVESSPFAEESIINSDVLAEAIGDAADDEDVKAIVFRVSSPGGSAVASDQILHAVQQAQAKGKKVVVSMGPYAASGGYYVSANADAIVASPTTITGSIGIFGGKLVVGEALDHYLGVKTAEIQTGSPYVTMFSAAEPFTNAQRQAFAGIIDRGYSEFLGVVAKGRKMTPEQVRAVAKGRVWTGAQAKERGLVDELGGLSTAVARAKQLAGIDQKTRVALRIYPQEKTAIEQLEELFGVSGEAARGAAVLGAVMGDERVLRAVRASLAQDEAALKAQAPAVTVR